MLDVAVDDTPGVGSVGYLNRDVQQTLEAAGTSSGVQIQAVE